MLICEVANTPFHIQGDLLLFFMNSFKAGIANAISMLQLQMMKNIYIYEKYTTLILNY